MIMKKEQNTFKPDHPESKADFIDACRRRGIKATHQRVEIFAILADSKEHPDVETIYKKVRGKIPMISLDTVYRTLKMLETQGMITRVGGISEKSRFDADTSPHYHFVCTRCGFIGDIYIDTPAVIKPLQDPGTLGAVESVYCELRGICNKCRQKAAKKK